MGSSSANLTTQADAEAINLLGAGGAAARDQGIALTGSNNRNIFGTAIESGRDVTINNTGLTDDGLESLVQKFTDGQSAQTEAFGKLAAAQQEQIGVLAESAQAGESKAKNNLLGMLALAALAVVALFVWKKL